MHQLNNSKLNPLLSANVKDFLWKILAWLAIAILGFIGFSSQNVYNGAMDGKKAKTENVFQQQKLDSLCSRSMIHQVYIEILQKQNEEYRKDIADIKNMLIDIYKNQNN